MTTFRYKGQTAGGAKVSGVLRAYDEFEAADKLRESVAIITKLEAVPEKKESVLSRPVAFKVKEKELALLCSQFAIILASGLSVERCVSMVAAQTKNKYLRRMLDKVSEEVGAGYSLAQSFENNAPYLPKTFTETLRAGEQSGTLESCFQRLHAYYDRSAKTRAKIVSTLTYPVMVIIVAIVVFVIIIAVAVPAFTDAFTDLGSGSLPGVTRALMAVSAFFTKWWWLVLAASMVSAVILTAATSSARRLENDRAARQAYLTVSSAARLLRDDILNASFVQETVKTTYTNDTSTETSRETTSPTGFTAAWLKAGKAAVDRDSGKSFTDTITLSVDGLDDVSAVFTMAPNYDITIVLHLADGGDSDCRLVLTLRENKADPTVSTVSGGDLLVRDVTTTTTTISWSPDNATIEKEAVVSKS
jgi:hypothetical protein